MLMAAPNVLLLDELTNDLDIPTLSVLESYLEDFPGAVIVVSHDRYFLDRVVEDVFAIEEGGKIARYTGNFSDYLAKRPPVLQAPAPARSRVSPERVAAPRSRAVKFTYKEQKEYEVIDDRIAEAEHALKDIHRQMAAAGDDFGRVQSLFAEQQAVEAQLDELLERWTYLNELAEEIERGRG